MLMRINLLGLLAKKHPIFCSRKESKTPFFSMKNAAGLMDINRTYEN
jgi:hypothetical protein